MPSESRIQNPVFHPLLFIFQLIQWIADKILSPEPPNPSTRLGRPKIAVIGAGITGVTSAAHCIGHGFDVVIFEAGDKESLGGIWSVSAHHSFFFPQSSEFSIITK
jgi:heterodisulfide reductase subunit A-like polyferredoxin